MGTIQYTLEPPEDFSQLQNLYDFLGWNSLKLTVHELEQMCNQSWYAIYAFNEKKWWVWGGLYQMVWLLELYQMVWLLELFAESVCCRIIKPRVSAKKC